jgi:hypothetical protein
MRLCFALVVATLTLAGCELGHAPRCAPLQQSVTTIVPSPEGIEYGLGLSTAAPCENEDLWFATFARNKSSQPLEVVFFTCGLTTWGTLQLSDPPGTGRCEAGGIRIPIAPGESLATGVDRLRVRSAAGQYQLRVLLGADTAIAAAIEIAVRDR